MAWPRSIRWRYSLRALLVFITLFALWAGYHSDRARRERKAADVLSARGASFGYHRGQGMNRSVWNYLRLAYPRFIEATWGERYITSVNIVSPLDIEVAEAIGDLPHIESVSIQSIGDLEKGRRFLCEGNLMVPETEPGAMARMLSSRTLRGIMIQYFRLSDDDCRALARHTSFQGLSFHHCQLTEEGFAQVLTLPRLRRVFIDDCSPTGTALRSYSGSRSLEDLYIHSTPIGHEFADFVAQSPSVRTIDFSSHTINDEFIKGLGRHPNLEAFTLQGCPLTTKCIPSLERMPALKRVYVPRSVAIVARERFKTARPDITVVIHPWSK